MPHPTGSGSDRGDLDSRHFGEIIEIVLAEVFRAGWKNFDRIKTHFGRRVHALLERSPKNERATESFWDRRVGYRGFHFVFVHQFFA